MSLPATYKAFIIPERLAEPQIQDLPTPKPGQGQILVKVHAASLNPVDWKIHKEDLWNYQYPISLGHDISGEVAAVGDGVQGFSVGDRVFVLFVHQALDFLIMFLDSVKEFIPLVKLASSNTVYSPQRPQERYDFLTFYCFNLKRFSRYQQASPTTTLLPFLLSY